MLRALTLGLFVLGLAAQPAPVRAEDEAPSAKQLAEGLAVYKKANCIGCHKWHGDGGGGYGGNTLSLRRTQLDRDNIVLVVRCGRPGTHMLYHDEKAWGEGRCYDGLKMSDLDENTRPGQGKFISEREIQSVTDYVLAVLKGLGEPKRKECLVFWGQDAVSTCKSYPDD